MHTSKIFSTIFLDNKEESISLCLVAENLELKRREKKKNEIRSLIFKFFAANYYYSVSITKAPQNV